MKVRQHTLPVLQNLLKRDPAAYKEEFEALWKQYVSELEVLRLADSKSATKKEDERRLGELATFVSHTCGSYPHAAQRFAPELVQLLKDRATALQADLRLVLAQACLLSRAKGHLPPIAALELAFELIRAVNDKVLRTTMYEFVVSDMKRSFAPATQITAAIKRSNGNKRAQTPLKGAQRLLFNECSSAQASVAAAKCALDALIELYKKRVWTDAAPVNAIGRACCDARTKIACTAVHFFLGVEHARYNDDEEEVEAAEHGDRDRTMQVALGAATHLNQHAKKTRKRQNIKDRSLKAAKKLLRKKKGDDDERPVFPAIELLEDPHRLCEKVLARLRAQKDKFEVRITFMDFISRVACAHKLQLLPFYSYMQRYLVAHQREVPRLLAIFAQACHEHVPPDELQPISRHIADAFVTERNAPEAMALGINALREIVSRVPSLLEEPEMLGFARDIAAYTKHRDKSVVVAARGWINVVRQHYPALLKTKDRGKASSGDRHRKPAAFGASTPATGIDGSDLLAQYETGQLDSDYDETAAKCATITAGGYADDSNSDSDGGGDWVNVAGDDDDDEPASSSKSSKAKDDAGWDSVEEEEDDNEEEEEEEDDEEMEEGDGDDEAEDDEGDEEEDEEEQQATIEATRILSDEDFARIRLLKKRQAELGRTRGTKVSEMTAGAGFVSAYDIEAYGVKRKANVEARKAAVLAGRERFEHKLHAGGKTNLEKRRTKNYQMVQKGALMNPKRRRAPVKEQLKRDKRKRRRI